VLLEQRVVDVVAGIAFVAGEIHGAIDVNGQIGIDLDQAPEVALIPVVAAPGLVGDVLDREAFRAWKPDVGERPFAAAVNRGLEDGVDLVARNHEPPAELVVARHQRAAAGKALFELVEDLLEV
jgi:hypothetical protein